MLRRVRSSAASEVEKRQGWNRHRGLEAVAEAETGVVIILGQDEDSEPTLDRLQAFFDGTANKPKGESRTYRNIGTGSQILKAPGLRQMRLLRSPLTVHSLSGFDLELLDSVAAAS